MIRSGTGPIWRRRALGLAVVVLLPAAVALWSRSDGELVPQTRRGVERGLHFLARGQSPDGQFPTYAWPGDDVARAQYVRTPFTASQVLHALAFVDGAERGALQERTVGFLVAHREPPGVWRYYGKDDGYYVEVHARFGHPKLPPDVDDTAQAWGALAEHGHAVESAALDTLTAHRAPSGLFPTWIARPEELTWMDGREREADLVVNLNAVFLFARAGREVPEVCAQVSAATQNQAFQRGTIWYPEPLAYAYVLSRAYADGPAPCLREAASRIRAYVEGRQQADGGWGSDLQTALAVITLLDTGPPDPRLERGIRALLRRQAADGGWQRAPLYRGAVFQYGSRELTTAFGLEALGKFLRQRGTAARPAGS